MVAILHCAACLRKCLYIISVLQILLDAQLSDQYVNNICINTNIMFLEIFHRPVFI
jgi:hypothetical protein